MSTAPQTPGPAEHLLTTLRGVASQAAEQRLANIAVSVILALLAELFAGLADLLARIKAGADQPPAQAPRQEPGHAKPRQPRQTRIAATKSARRHAAMRPAGGALGQFFTPSRPPVGAAPAAAASAPTATYAYPVRQSARPPPSLDRETRRHKPAPWRAYFVTITK